MKAIAEYKLEGNNAVFSDCGNYRYALWRIWNEPKGIVMFIGLNPSRADARTALRLAVQCGELMAGVE